MDYIQSVEFSRPDYWSGLPFLSPGDLPNLGIKPGSPALHEDSLPTELSGKPTTNLNVLLTLKGKTLEVCSLESGTSQEYQYHSFS